ncbi:MAG: YbhB/YbcL family Raf kinase inhibitor-like protein [Rhodospirillaceae bacterium]
MKTAFRGLVGAAVLFAAVTAGAARAGDFVVSSADIADSRTIAETFVFNGFGGCGGGNLSPALQWQGAPAGTRSFAITMFDPDAPTGSGWWHWVLYNLPPSTDRLARGAGDPSRQVLPIGSAQARNDFGAVGYGGPCPPRGARAHHFVFTVFALNIDALPVRPGSTAAMISYAIHEHILAEAKLTTIYGRF